MFDEKIMRVSEKEFVEVVDKIIKQLKLKTYTFGLYTEEDLAQEVYCESIKAMPDWDGRSLANFLFINAKNRLFNIRRNEWYRPDCGCSDCDNKQDGETKHPDGKYCQKFLDWKKRNLRKANIASLPSIPANFDYTSNDDYTCQLDIQDMQDIIDMKLPIKLRDIYLRMKDGDKVSHVDKQKVLRYLKKILKDNNG